MSQITVLIVDDEEDMRILNEMYLLNSGIQTIQAPDGATALQVVREGKADLVLLDIMMPDMDGFEVCKEIRTFSDVPIIFLSAKGEEWDKVKALKMGGDDYVVKPYSPGELIARIEAVLRRTAYNEKTGMNMEIQYGRIGINKLSRKVTVDKMNIPLTLKEYDLLIFLIQHSGQVLKREELLKHVWGGEYGGSLRTVDTHIKTLRMKLNTADYIQTVWGIGYKFEVPGV